MERDRFGQEDRLAEFYLYLVKRIPLNQLPVFKIVEESFQRGNLAFYGFRLIALVKVCDKTFQYIRSGF